MTDPPTILVVDDNATNRLILTRTMEKAGYAALAAEDGYQAVDVANEHSPDLLLLDVMMPGRDGLETCRILKSKRKTATIPIIFVTAVTDAGEIVKAFDAGGCDYVTKPFRPQEVLARVSAHIKLRQAEEELRERSKEMEALARQLAETNTELAMLSRLDPLTKLFNRRTWEEAAVEEHERFQRHHFPYSIIMVDVDHFKTFNDSQGHQAGDDCLRQIAEAIVSACRRIDVVGRYGGEEFVILAPDTDSEAAINLAERVRQSIWNLAIPHPASPSGDRVTISLGVSTGASGSWGDVLGRADGALYVAKRAGRNMVFENQESDSESKPPTKAVPDVPEPPPPSKNRDARVSVLVVDDEPTNRAVCRGCLEKAGYRVEQAVNGYSALDKVNTALPDVIIMDVVMPDMDGLECTRRLKARADTRDIPIIVLSARSKGDDVLAGLEAGADEYLTKPIRTAELLMRVRSMAGLHRERQNLLESYRVRGEHVRILACLVEYCRAIGASHQLDEVLEHTVNAAAEVLQSRRISIMLPNPEGNRLAVRRSLGANQETIQGVEVPLGEPIAGRVFASGESFVINTDAELQSNVRDYKSPFFASVPLISTPLNASNKILGVLNVTDRIGNEPFEPHQLEYVELIAKVTATAIHDIYGREAHDQASDSIMVALARLAEHRDRDTGLHVDRVTMYCHMLADTLRATEKYRDTIDDAFMHNILRSAPLHDIGKVAIPDHILLHPGRLSPDQTAVMQTHTTAGADTLQSLIERTPGVDFLVMAADIAHYHHEWYDGTGYPKGISGEDIPLAARITALADVYDALTTKRVYKDAFTHDKSVAIILEGSGTQFDPTVVEAFLTREKEFAELAKSLADTPKPVSADAAPAPSAAS